VLARFRAPGGGGGGVSAAEMQQRMLLRFIKECILCAQDDILAPGSMATNPKAAYATGDIGAVFGIGFPPFLGGPFRYCDLKGAQHVADDMRRFADKLGPHFDPPQLLLDVAKAGATFH
jgi:enoyl-CoA hydratase/long-chain 3-hydroxyacyl-CoA dehydrogenase